MMDGAFTPTFDETAAIVLAMARLAATTATAALVFRRVTIIGS